MTKNSTSFKAGPDQPNWKTGSYINHKGYRVLSISGKYILEHVYIMEKHLNRKLLKHEIVHHKDGNRLNNTLDNLEVMTRSAHSKLHNTGKVRTKEMRKEMCRA